MNTAHDPHLSDFLKQTYDKLGRILDDLQTADRIEVEETSLNISMKQAIVDMINVLYTVPNLREQGKREQGQICKVKYLTLCGRCSQPYHHPPVSPTIPMEDGKEDMEGDNAEEENIEDIIMGMNNTKIGGR